MGDLSICLAKDSSGLEGAKRNKLEWGFGVDQILMNVNIIHHGCQVGHWMMAPYLI